MFLLIEKVRKLKEIEGFRARGLRTLSISLSFCFVFVWEDFGRETYGSIMFQRFYCLKRQDGRAHSIPSERSQAASETFCIDFLIDLIRKSIEKEPGILGDILY